MLPSSFLTYAPKKLLIIFAGLPATTQLEGISFVTIDPTPIITLSPIVTGRVIIVPAPIKTCLPIMSLPTAERYELSFCHAIP